MKLVIIRNFYEISFAALVITSDLDFYSICNYNCRRDFAMIQNIII